MPINRSTFTSRFPTLTEGQAVYSRDGERLGKVASLADDYLIIQKGFFFPKDFTIRYDDISETRDGSIYLNLDGDDLSEWKADTYAGWEQAEGLNAGSIQAEPRPEYLDRYQDRSKEQVQVPVVEEELEATKTMRNAGEVQVRKIVHTELRHFTVPVTREEVRVERVPASEQAAASRAAEGAFEEKTVKVPVMEEEVNVTKRPVVKEEVRVSKERVTDEKQVSGEVRKEEVRVEGEDKLRRKAG